MINTNNLYLDIIKNNQIVYVKSNNKKKSAGYDSV